MRKKNSAKKKSGLIKLFYLVLALGVLMFALVAWRYAQRQQAFEQARQAQQQQQALILKRQQEKEAAVIRQRRAFAKRIGDIAVSIYPTYHLLPSVTLAQAILESDWGTSELANKYHNYFGIKGVDPKSSINFTTKEYVDGKWQKVTAQFATFASDREGLIAHAKLFSQGTTWNKQQYAHVLAAKDYKTAAQALQQDGYATDPKYSSKLIAVIEQYNLARYDQKVIK